MDHYSILDPGLSQTQAGMPTPGQIGLARDMPPQELPKIDALPPQPEIQAREQLASSRMRVPREDSISSLADMALGDLDAILQLLAERAEYITHATGAAIALREGEEMVCRASAGSSAPALGAHLQVDSGLSGESVRTRQILRCDDAEADPRVNRESCRTLGIASVVVLPLVREQEVTGLFELFSDQAYAFAERDLEALERLGEMVHTALQHTEAARANPGVLEAESLTAGHKVETPHPDAPVLMEEETKLSKPGPAPVVHPAAESAAADIPGLDSNSAVPSPAIPAQLATSRPEETPAALPKVPESYPKPVPASPPLVAPRPGAAVVPELANIRKCETCGFPISESRKLCLDCEARLLQTQAPMANRTGKAGQGPELSSHFLSGGMNANQSNQLWIFENRYLVSAVVLFVLVLIAMLLSHSS